MWERVLPTEFVFQTCGQGFRSAAVTAAEVVDQA
ncbi:hypothetical protein PMI22_00031, partial [Pseudomonas sp. GM21]